MLLVPWSTVRETGLPEPNVPAAMKRIVQRKRLRKRQDDTYTKFPLFSGVCEPDRNTAARVFPPTNHPSVKTFNSFLGSGSSLKSM